MKLKILILIVLILYTKLVLGSFEQSIFGHVGVGDPANCASTMDTMLAKIEDKEYYASELVCGGNKYLTVHEKLGMEGRKPITKVVHVLSLNYENEDILLVPHECEDESDSNSYIFAIGFFSENPKYGESATIKRAFSFNTKNISYVEVSKDLVKCTFYGSGD